MSKWIMLTELGEELGFSAVRMGKELGGLGLRDPDTKKPTALSDQKILQELFITPKKE